MPATKIIGQSISRRGWGVILLVASVLAVGAAALLDSAGLASGDLTPMSFISAAVLIKLGLFTFWPVIAEKGAEASTVLHAVLQRGRHDHDAGDQRDVGPPEHSAGSRPPVVRRLPPLRLWNEQDPRVDIGSFGASVPAFVLSHDQRFLDWNAAFGLLFAELSDMRRGAHVSVWYAHLDNFRRVAKRTEKLYGEGILPLTDRERITFISAEFGRMVFTRIMSPIIDRESARIIGWNVVLNVNSVNKRELFFERLFAEIASETRKARYAAGFDGVVAGYAPYRHLVERHVRASGGAGRVLDLMAHTGNAASALLAHGHKVTAVDSDTQLLRQLRGKCSPYGDAARLVRLPADALAKLPDSRFPAAVMMLAAHRLPSPSEVYAQVFRALVPGGVLSVSGLVRPDGSEAQAPADIVAGLFDAVRLELEASGRYDAVKHQLGHVVEREQELARMTPYRSQTITDLRGQLIEAGFVIVDEASVLDGHGALLVARKN